MAARPHYVTGKGGQIRLWQAGEGSDLRVVAGLVAAASDLADTLAAIAPGHRVTVFELPGLGGSAGHEAREPDAVAEALRDAFSACGIETGPLLLCDLAGALAARLAPVARPLLWYGAERSLAWARLGLAPPDLAPRTDGTHLNALWTFLRDRHVLVPEDPTQPDPAGDPLPAPAELDRALTAFAVEPERYTALWRSLSAALASAPQAAGFETLDALTALLPPAGPSSGRKLPPTAPLGGGRLWHQEVETARGRMHLRRVGGEGRPLLVIPTGGGSSSQFEPVLHGLARDRQVFSVDYLGNGLSEKPARPNVAIADLAADLAALLEELGLGEVDVWGSHTGAVVGLELAVTRPDLVGRLVMEGPVYLTADAQADILSRYFPPIEPDPWGRHLQLVWNWRRDMFLFWPWYRAERGAARRLGLPTPRALHDYAIGILESGPTYDGAYRAAFSYDTRSRLPLLRTPALVTAGPNDMLVNALAETRALGHRHVLVKETPTTVWWPDPHPEEAAATLAIYDAFLRADACADA